MFKDVFAPHVILAIAGLACSTTIVQAVEFAAQCGDNRTLNRAVVQYLPEVEGLRLPELVPTANKQTWAWREYQGSSGALCVHLDAPIDRELTPSEAVELYRFQAAQHRSFANSLQPRDEIVLAQVNSSSWHQVERPPNSPIGPVTRQSLNCAGPKSRSEQKYWRFADQDLSFVARLRPYKCPDAMSSAGGGTAFMVNPTLAMTALHVLNDEAGNISCSYRVLPGAQSFGSGNPHPFGGLSTSAILKSPRGAELVRGTAADKGSDDVSDYVANDYAMLELEQIGVEKKSGRQVIWPAIVFGPSIAQPARRVYKSGYPNALEIRQLRAPGASVTADGAFACVDDANVQAFAFLAYPGDSGAPIWLHPDDDPMGWLSVISLVSISTTNHRGAELGFGPRFSMSLYWRLVRHLHTASGTPRSDVAK